MAFNPNIPAPNDLLSNSQGQLLSNNQILDSVFGVNHYTFSDTSGNAGKHNFVDMPVGAIPTISAGDGGIYTKSSSGSQLFYTADGNSDEYQLTRCDTAEFSKFATNTNYSGTLSGGWTFLPGGLLLQYGSIATPTSGSTGTAVFPKPFTSTPFSITTSIVRAPFSSSSQTFYVGVVSNTQFTYSNSSSGNNPIYWMAIGI